MIILSGFSQIVSSRLLECQKRLTSVLNWIHPSDFVNGRVGGAKGGGGGSTPDHAGVQRQFHFSPEWEKPQRCESWMGQVTDGLLKINFHASRTTICPSNASWMRVRHASVIVSYVLTTNHEHMNKSVLCVPIAAADQTIFWFIIKQSLNK